MTEHVQIVRTWAPLRNEADYNAAMSRLVALMDADPPEGSADFVELVAVGTLLSAYEAEHYYPFPPRKKGLWRAFLRLFGR